LSEALSETLLEIEAQREADVLKQRIHRAREKAGMPLPRSGAKPERRVRPAKEYGAPYVTATEIPVGTPVHECRVCGFTWHSRTAEDDLCVECRERAERRSEGTS
jgi:rubrerythrin